MPTPRLTSTQDADGALLISLAGVAELAQVQRPVASMWRSRFRTGARAFPTAVGRKSGGDLFDAVAVADWLVETGHGHNPEARADAAASAAPAGVDFADAGHVAELGALIALRALTASVLAAEDLLELAREVDPADVFLRSEIDLHARRPRSWAAYVDALVDAAFTPAAALDRISRRAMAAAGADAAAGALRTPAIRLVSALTAELAGSGGIRLGIGITGDLLRAIVDRMGDGIELGWPAGPGGRALRRRAAAAGVPPIAGEPRGRSVTVARIPATAGDSVEDMLLCVESLALELSEGDSAIVLGPSRVLVAALGERSERIRADLLRTGRVRAIILLPEGLVASATREAMSVWAIGPASDRPIVDRATAIADLTGEPLTESAIDGLIRDVVVTIDGGRLAARSPRFAQFVRTSSLLARRDGLIGGAPQPRHRGVDPRTLPALLDEAVARLGGDHHSWRTIVDDPAPRAQEMRFGDAVDDGFVRIVSGVRLREAEVGEEGFVLVGMEELADLSRIGTRRVDRLAFTAGHPNGQLTRPGDVVFCTAPDARAWVDDEGSHVVPYPARVARISHADPGGLIPELMAADMRKGAAGASAWRRWRLRTIEPVQRAPMRSALQAAAATRADLERRIADLDRYADLLADSVSARAVRVIPEDADASGTSEE